jgi:hypothetical protein
MRRLASLTLLVAVTSAGCELEPPPRTATREDAARGKPDARCSIERAQRPPHLAKYTADDAVTCDAECVRGAAASCLASGAILERSRTLPRDPARARAAYERGCAYDVGPACTRVARGMRGVREGVYDAAKVYSTFRRACELGDAEGCVELERLAARGVGIKADPEGARRELQRRCDAGLGVACSSLAELSERTTDAAGKLALQERACAGADGAACLASARTEEAAAPAQRDGRRLLERHARACELGAWDGCARAAAILDEGLFGVAPDRARAFAMFDAACDDGLDGACIDVGARLDLGDGVAPDRERGRALLETICTPSPALCYDRANAWVLAREPAHARLAFDVLDASCDATRDARACGLAGELLLVGVGTAVDLPAARGRLAKACAAGQHDACRSLGDAWAGTDDARAASFWAEACSHADARACHALAGAYERGAGVPRDLRHASALLIGLRDHEDVDARKAIDASVEAMRMACDARGDASCLSLGLRIVHRLTSDAAATRAPHAFAAFQRGCDVGHVVGACVRLARAYADGYGTKRDVAKATKLLESACVARDDEACVELSLLVARGPKPDEPLSAALLDDACRRDDARACAAHAAGVFQRRSGYGDEWATAFARTAEDCEAEVAQACYAQGLALEFDAAGDPDRERARPFHEHACTGGVPAACLRLAKLDPRHAGLLPLACELGEVEACAPPPPPPPKKKK